MAEMMVLEAAKRDVLGKQVRHLRKDGVIPGVLYGPAFEDVPLQMKWTDLRLVLRDAGGSSIIQVKLDNGESHNALVRKVQRHPLRGDVLHVDFYRVRMDVAIRTAVPVVIVGSKDVIEDAGGVVNHEMNSVTVECLPGDLPAEIPVDVSVLKEIGDTILASQLPELPGVTYMVEGHEVVVSSSYLEQMAEEEEFDSGVEPELVRRESDDFDDEV